MSYSKTNWQDLPSLDTPINATRLNKIENGIADAHGAIGVNSYSASSTYAVGDYCIYNNKMYKCNTAISTAEAFNSSKWTEVTIPSELIDKGSVVSATEPTGNNRAKIWFKKGTNIQNQIYVKNNSNQYETFANTGAFEKEVTDARGTFNNLDSRIDSIETEVTNARGSFSSLDDRLDDIETEIAEDTITGEGENIILNGTAQNAMKKIVIKGKTEQEQLTGKNKFNVNGEMTQIEGAPTTTITNGEIIIQSSQVNSSSALLDYVSVEANKTYTIKFDLKQGKARIAFRLYDNSKNTINNSAIQITGVTYLAGYAGYYKDSNSVTITIPTGQNIAYIRPLTIAMNATSDNIYSNYQVELGSTATPYEPYCGGVPSPNPNYPQTIHNLSGDLNIKVQNKNILPIDYNKYTTSGTYGYYKLTNIEEDLTISISVKDTSVSMTGIFFGFSGAGADNSSGTQWIMSNGTQISTTLSNSYTSSGTTTKLKYFSFYPNNSTTFNKIFSRYNIQVEKGTATSYVPHAEQNLPFTFSAGQALMQGGMLTDSGVYNENIKVILTGTETWYTTGATDNTALHYFTLSETAKSDWIKCTVCPYDNLVFSSDTIGGYINTSNNRLLVRDTHLTNSDWKTYLAEQYANGTPVIVEYKLATPTTTAYTSTQQSQYNAIKNAISYNEQTNISSTSTDLPADLEAEAFERMSNQNYVTQEIPIGLWQGKTFYRKVIDFGELPNNTTKEVYHGIADIAYIKSCTGYAMTTGGSGLMLPSYNGTIVTNVYANREKIGVYTSGDRSSFTTCYITIEYTKA